MRRTLTMIGILVLGLGGMWPAPAGAQARVNVLCSPDPAWCEALKREFSKATGIQTEFVRLSSGAGLARLQGPTIQKIVPHCRTAPSDAEETARA